MRCKTCGEDYDIELFLDAGVQWYDEEHRHESCLLCRAEFAKPKEQREEEKKRGRYKSQRHYRLMKDYGLPTFMYNEMLKQQGYKCKVCGISHSDYGKNFDVDHNHTNGNVRGLLCNSCNRLIARYNDDPAAMYADADDNQLLEAAAEYVIDDGAWIDPLWESFKSLQDKNKRLGRVDPMDPMGRGTGMYRNCGKGKGAKS